MRSFSLFVRLEAVAFGDVPGPALLLRLEEISALHGPSYCRNCSQLPSCRSANLLLLTFQLRYRFRTMLPRALPLGLRNRCKERKKLVSDRQMAVLSLNLSKEPYQGRKPGE